MGIPGPRSPIPDLTIERLFAAELGVSWVAGVDEAGRGALAGPVFAAAVMLPLESDALGNILFEVRDSKLLTPSARESLYSVICDCSPAFSIGSATAEWIDRHGILPATRAAMTEAVAGLLPPAQAVLVDGPLRLVSSNLPQRPIVRGDRQSLSIAAASILAKVSRDRYMIQLGERYPEYGFGRHKGYGTAEHLAALGRLGPCPAHRRSFAPLRSSLF
jgi:ribonuclease HII